MSNFEVTKRELAVGVVILLIMISIGFYISNVIHNYYSEKNEEYFKALKIDNQENIFQHAINTDVGSILSHGEIQSVKPVKDELIKGEYFSIVKAKEVYTMHTRTESYKCGKRRCHRTVTYWTWDQVSKEKFTADKFKYLGLEFDSGVIELNNHKKTDTVQLNALERYVFYTIPKNFNASIFAKVKHNKLSDTKVYYEENIVTIIQEKEKQADNSTMIFWIVWIVLAIALIIGFVALDNKYLNNK